MNNNEQDRYAELTEDRRSGKLTQDEVWAYDAATQTADDIASEEGVRSHSATWCTIMMQNYECLMRDLA